MLTKILILAVLALILFSLFSALALLLNKSAPKERMVQALTLRVALSVGLFIALLAGFYFGVIPQHGVR
jgi:undecaprenyl pyrophosphate phosphatase UppP